MRGGGGGDKELWEFFRHSLSDPEIRLMSFYNSLLAFPARNMTLITPRSRVLMTAICESMNSYSFFNRPIAVGRLSLFSDSRTDSCAGSV